MPADNAHGSLLRIVTAPPVPGNVTAVEIDARTKAPLVKGGCLGTAEAGGFRRQSLRNFLPIPSSLFTKKPSPFHMGWYFGKAPTVNPSVKNQRFLTAPFSKGALRPVAADNAHGGFLRIVASLTRPVSAACRRTYSLFTLHYSLNPPGIVTAVVVDPQTNAPLAKGGWFCLWQNRGDSVAKATDFFPIPFSLFPKKPSPFHMGLYFLRSACCRIPQSRLRRASSHRPGALRPVPADTFAWESSANRYCPSSARYRYRAKWGTKISVLCTH